MPGPAEQWRTKEIRYFLTGVHYQKDGTPTIQNRGKPIGPSVSETGFPTEGTVFDQKQALIILQAISSD